MVDYHIHIEARQYSRNWLDFFVEYGTKHGKNRPKLIAE